MSIKLLDQSVWPEIIRIQAQVYVDIEPESLDVLQSKWHFSPECCFVYQPSHSVLGYLLAHAWYAPTLPKLYQVLPTVRVDSQPILFLHDLAIAPHAAGKGIGVQMVNNLLSVAARLDFETVNLVSVQESAGFWRKMGFIPVNGILACPSYGDGATVMEYRVKS